MSFKHAIEEFLGNAIVGSAFGFLVFIAMGTASTVIIASKSYHSGREAEREVWKQEAVEREYGGYNEKTGEWEWTERD